MRLVGTPTQDGAPSQARRAVLFVLAILGWLSRMSPPVPTTSLHLDGTYLQVLGEALKRGLHFGRDIVFTSGPLAYFPSAPYDPDLDAAKLWLWEILLGGTVAALLWRRLFRRGTWLDIAAGALILVVLPIYDDGWLFALGLLAGDLWLSTGRTDASRSRIARTALRALALLLLAILTLIKVSSLTFAIAIVGVLGLHAALGAGLVFALATLAAFALVESLLWVGIGQRIQDLVPYFTRSIELASGFDSAMSQPPATIAVVLCIACAGLCTSLCAAYAEDAFRSRGLARGDARIAQAALGLVALVLAYKAGFARASDHTPNFFTTAMIVPLFLVPLERAPSADSDAKAARLRCSVALLAMLCGMFSSSESIRSPRRIAENFAARVRASVVWLGEHEEARRRLDLARASLAADHALPRTKSIVGAKSISSFAEGDGVVFLNDLDWRPRPVFQSFSVFTERTTRENAQFVAGSTGPDFMLWRSFLIDDRLPASDDPLTFQVLMRDFRLRAFERGFLLMERAEPRATLPRTTLARGQVAWNERFDVAAGPDPCVLQAWIRPSLLGRARAALFQTPEVFAELDLAGGSHWKHRIVPFALEAGVVLRPWLESKESWVQFARGEALDPVVNLSFRTSVESAFLPEIEFQLVAAPDLSARAVTLEFGRELLLGMLGDLPLRYESEFEPQLTGWSGMPGMPLVRAPARLDWSAGPGTFRLSGRLFVPPAIAASPGFAGVDVLVVAREGGAQRECARFELRPSAAGAPRAVMDVAASFESAGEFSVLVEAVSGGNPATAQVGLATVRVQAK
ncbi:MAG TPA: hypothetical protein VM509_04485 [Planctomycetota bacterium]|nr:hypothetical protein [Planctomycetota bacterium]